VAHPGPYSVGTGVLTLRYSVEVKNEWSRTCAPPNPTPSWLDRDMCTARHTYVPVSVKFVSGIAVPTFPGTRCLRVPNCTESHSWKQSSHTALATSLITTWFLYLTSLFQVHS